jgi:hypothetical protein
MSSISSLRNSVDNKNNKSGRDGAGRPARVICRACERGEKRRSWGTERAGSLEQGAPALRLYEELSRERELIASLHIRYEYLVGSVSDVGDLLIELFSPQLREETESEQLRLVMAETEGGGGGTRVKKRGSTKMNDVDKNDNKDGPSPGGTANKVGRKGGEWEGLGLGKIFGWNPASDNNSSKNSATDATNGKLNKKPKVIALLPSCYCPLKKGIIILFLIIINYILYGRII